MENRTPSQSLLMLLAREQRVFSRHVLLPSGQQELTLLSQCYLGYLLFPEGAILVSADTARGVGGWGVISAVGWGGDLSKLWSFIIIRLDYPFSHSLAKENRDQAFPGVIFFVCLSLWRVYIVGFSSTQSGIYRR